MTTERATLLAAVSALVVAGGLPLLAMLVASVSTPEGFGVGAYASLWSSVRPWALLLRSLTVGGIATGCALAIGWPAGILCERTDLPGRDLFTLVLGVPFVLPTYIQAVGGARVLGHGAPYLDSLLGTGLVLGSCFAPLVLVGTRASLRTVDPRLEEAARLSAGWLATLRGVTLPLGRRSTRPEATRLPFTCPPTTMLVAEMSASTCAVSPITIVPIRSMVPRKVPMSWRSPSPVNSP